MTTVDPHTVRAVLRAEQRAELGGYRQVEKIVPHEEGLQRWASSMWDNYRHARARVDMLERNQKVLIRLVEELMESGLPHADENWYAKRLAEVRHEKDVPESP